MLSISAPVLAPSLTALQSYNESACSVQVGTAPIHVIWIRIWEVANVWWSKIVIGVQRSDLVLLSKHQLCCAMPFHVLYNDAKINNIHNWYSLYLLICFTDLITHTQKKTRMNKAAPQDHYYHCVLQLILII